MLPDLPLLKTELQEVLSQYLRAQVHLRLGVFNEAPKQIVHEGKSMRTWRADGSVEDSDLKAASAEMTIKLSDVPALTPHERIQQLDQMAEEMAKQMSEHLFGSLNTTLDRAGQVVDRKGKPFDAETILAALESIQIDFDEDGQLSPLTMVGHPDMKERVQRAFEQLEHDPSFKARHDALMQRKKAEWRDREAARKLVG